MLMDYPHNVIILFNYFIRDNFLKIKFDVEIFASKQKKTPVLLWARLGLIS